MKFKLSLSCFLFLLLLTRIDLRSQGNCPPFLEWDNTNPIDAGFEPNIYDLFGEVEYNFKDLSTTGGSGIGIKVDWSSLINHRHYWFTDSELKQAMYKAVIVSYLHDNNMETFAGTKDFIFYEETECKITRSCYLWVEKTTKMFCKTPGYGSDPDFVEENDEYYLPVRKTYNCGSQCCEIKYTVECDDQNPLQINIISKTRSPGFGTQCGPDESDCLSGWQSPCESNCK